MNCEIGSDSLITPTPPVPLPDLCAACEEGQCFAVGCYSRTQVVKRWRVLCSFAPSYVRVRRKFEYSLYSAIYKTELHHGPTSFYGRSAEALSLLGVGRHCEDESASGLFDFAGLGENSSQLSRATAVPLYMEIE